MAKKSNKTQSVGSAEELPKKNGGNAAPAVVTKPNQEAEKPLDVKEQKLLRSCEDAIKSGLKCFCEVGEALRTINEEKLYRGEEYSNFDVYCANRWSMSGSHARRLIEAANIMDKLREKFSPKGESDHLLPESETHVRPLTRFEKKTDQWVVAWQKALNKSEVDKKRITGQMVDAIVDEMLGEQPKAATRPKAADNNSNEEDKTASDVMDKIAKAKLQLEKGKTQKVVELLDQIQELIRKHFGLSD